jgi:hypothetical protein
MAKKEFVLLTSSPKFTFPLNDSDLLSPLLPLLGVKSSDPESNRLLSVRFFVRKRRRFKEFLLLVVFGDLEHCEYSVLMADSLIEKLETSCWCEWFGFEFKVPSHWSAPVESLVSCEIHDTDQGRSDGRLMLRINTFDFCAVAVIENSSLVPTITSAESPNFSVDVPCSEVISPFRQVATESVTSSEVSVSRLIALSESVYSPEASQSVEETTNNKSGEVASSGWCSSHSWNMTKEKSFHL